MLSFYFNEGGKSRASADFDATVILSFPILLGFIDFARRLRLSGDRILAKDRRREDVKANGGWKQTKSEDVADALEKGSNR